MTVTTLRKFYIGDLVEVIGGDANPRGMQMRLYDYYCESDRLIPLVNNAQTVYAYEYADNLKLVERGNYFKHMFGMRDQMRFYNFVQEANFWRSVNEMHELRNPATDLFYTWTLEQAIAALEDGSAHAFFYSSSLGVLLKPMFGGFVFDDPDVAERMRQASLAELRSLDRLPVDA